MMMTTMMVILETHLGTCFNLSKLASFFCLKHYAVVIVFCTSLRRLFICSRYLCFFISDKTRHTNEVPAILAVVTNQIRATACVIRRVKISKGQRERGLLSETAWLYFLHKIRKIACLKRDYTLQNCKYIGNMVKKVS